MITLFFYCSLPADIATIMPMTKQKGEKIEQKIAHLLSHCGCISAKQADDFRRSAELRTLSSDGSNRRFFRAVLKGKCLCLAVLPATAAGDDLAEARSAGLIGRHLASHGVPVPAVLGWDETSGLLLFEDLGDVRLHGLAEREREEDLRGWYRQVVDRLVHMQLSGARGFDTGWCWDTPRYDRDLMIDRESRYFLKAFWQDMLGLEPPGGIEDEFFEIASMIDNRLADVFLHRDFQSRNIMIADGRVRFIDYQSGRLGPPGYDLASLLIDPYAGLTDEFQEEMLGYYLDAPAIRQTFAAQDLRQQYPLLALQRNLQILGAFSFLSSVRKKPFFSRYIASSVTMLRRRLREPVFSDFPILRAMAERAQAAVSRG